MDESEVSVCSFDSDLLGEGVVEKRGKGKGKEEEGIHFGWFCNNFFRPR